MALHRRALLGSLAVAAVAGCVGDGPGEAATEPTGSASPTASESPTGTESGYASCDPDLYPGEELHTAGGVPDDLSEQSAAEYARALEKDLVLAPPEERNQGYLGLGEVTAETVEYGFLVTVEVTGGYQRGDPEGTATGTPADFGQHVATYFINEQVVRRAEDTTAELDPRDHGEVVVCESA